MKKSFTFKAGQVWDGDEPMFAFLEDILLEDGHSGWGTRVKKDTKIIIEVRRIK